MPACSGEKRHAWLPPTKRHCPAPLPFFLLYFFFTQSPFYVLSHSSTHFFSHHQHPPKHQYPQRDTYFVLASRQERWRHSLQLSMESTWTNCSVNSISLKGLTTDDHLSSIKDRRYSTDTTLTGLESNSRASLFTSRSTRTRSSTSPWTRL